MRYWFRKQILFWSKKEFDNRPYVSVQIFGRSVVALLDSGASHSVIGSAGIYLLQLFKLTVQTGVSDSLRTADGKAQPIAGVVSLPLQIGNLVRVLKVLVVPSLEHAFILGSDFCNLFNITVDFGSGSYYVGDQPLNTNMCLMSGRWSDGNNKICSRAELKEAQAQQLTALIEQFKSISSSKLGRTDKIMHKIDTGDAEPIKQRHHALSPYKLEILNKELDKMAPVETCVIEIEPHSIESDHWYVNMVRNVQDSPESYPDWKVENGVLLKHTPLDFDLRTNIVQWKLVIPKEQRMDVFKACHDDPQAAHLGIYKTLHRIRELYYWPRLLQDVRKYVRSCESCAAQKVNSTARPGLMGHPKKVNFPWQYISTDILGPLPRSKNGYCYILAVSDYFTKFCLLHPLRKANAISIVKYLEEQVFLVYGAPQVVACDNGVQFTSNLFQNLIKTYGGTIHYNASFHAQVNAVERVNRVVETAIRSYLNENEHRNWDKEIHKIGFALRTAVHESSGYVPTFLNFGRYVPADGSYYGKLEAADEVDLDNLNQKQYGKEIDKLPQLYKEVRRHLRQAHQKNEKYYNLRKRPADIYHAGDKVWKRNFVLSNKAEHFAAKLAPKYILCTVRRVISRLVYELNGPDGRKIGKFHVKDLKPYRGSENVEVEE
ncbi:hypothetical protein NQ315_012243 [Exocentrus adspersus]|uniref:RNA-directed DNA polymerase n=1 Tax=Exocentrus adspersus TaxID=1586481 RepID=A0AAV8VEI8_9CUCU|nr:hypothetical protein NQ315_012243 [Exocentrus adspersus]